MTKVEADEFLRSHCRNEIARANERICRLGNLIAAMVGDTSAMRVEVEGLKTILQHLEHLVEEWGN